MSGPQSNNWRSNDNWRVPGARPRSRPESTSTSRWDNRDNRNASNYSGSTAQSWGTQRQQTHQEHQSQTGADDQDTTQIAIAEGRRIYLGNLIYRIQPPEISSLISSAGFPQGAVSGIHVSIDPVSGRNPGYCFVDFKTRDDAERALEKLGGTLLRGRPVKVGPCKPKGEEKRWRSEGYKPTFQRWGDWKGERGASEEEQGPYGALEHMRGAWQASSAPRVYVGGIGKMKNQEEHDREIREYFEGFKIVAISKRITPHPETRDKPGNHHYCFVDFESVEEAEAAIKALNGTPVPGSKLRLQMSTKIPQTLR